MTECPVNEGRAALDATTCTDEMMDFFRVGLVRELVEALERERESHVETAEIMRRAIDQRDQWKELWRENLLQAASAMGERDRANEALDEIAEIADSYRVIDAEQILEVLRPLNDEDS